MFLEASSPNFPSKTAYLTSTLGSYGGIIFKYHMFGANMGSVAVEVKSTGTWTQVWVRTGEQQASHDDAWLTAQVSFAGPVDQVRFVGVTGSDYRGDAAVGEVDLLLAGCLALTKEAPYPKARSTLHSSPPPHFIRSGIQNL